MTTSWIQSFTGIRFDPIDPDPATINIVDIAHALGSLARFNGHTLDFYSVAQHSVLVSRTVPPEDALWGLMHDAAEAYCGDLATPLKRHSGVMGREFCRIEDRILLAVADRFGLEYPPPDTVRDADLRLLATECREVMGGQLGGDWKLTHEPLDIRIIPLDPKRATRLFLEEWRRLTQ